MTNRDNSDDDFSAIEEQLKQLFGEKEEESDAGEMIPACLGVLVRRLGDSVVITQAQLDDIDSTRLRVAIDGPSETITLTLEKVES